MAKVAAGNRLVLLPVALRLHEGALQHHHHLPPLRQPSVILVRLLGLLSKATLGLHRHLTRVHLLHHLFRAQFLDRQPRNLVYNLAHKFLHLRLPRPQRHHCCKALQEPRRALSISLSRRAHLHLL